MADKDDPSRREGRYDRRELLRRAGVGAVALGAAGSGLGQAFYGPLRFKGRWLKGDLSIIQWAHFVPAYDVWFDKTWIVQWGQKNDVQVKVDHILNGLLPARMAAESARREVRPTRVAPSRRRRRDDDRDRGNRPRESLLRAAPLQGTLSQG